MIMAETAKLRENHLVSRIIKGGWQLAGDHGSVDRADAVADMEQFLDAGITTFDCADIYTGVEEMIGDFIYNVRQNRGQEVAERICVHTKLVPDLSRLKELTDSEVEVIVDRSLKRLQVDCLDLVQFFWWDLDMGTPVKSLDILKRLQEKGKIKNLGITNWDVEGIARFVENGFDIISAQVQYSILDRRPEKGLSEWAAANNIQLLCYGSLAGGFITDKWLGQEDPGYHFENRSLIKYRLVIDEFGSWELFQTLLRTLQSIGDKHDVGLSSVAIRYVLERPQVAAAIVGARYARHLPQTMEAFTFTLDQEDYARLQGILDQSQGPDGKVYGLESDRSGRHGRIMKYELNTSPDAQVLGEGR